MIGVAKKAAELVMKAKNSLSEKEREEYLKAVRSLGPMIIRNGLAGSLLFAKKKEWPEELVNHLDELIELQTGKKGILKKVENGSIFDEDYLWIQIAALESVRWLKRYSEIILGGEET